MKIIATIYRSSRIEGMYLYVGKTEALTRVPEPLLQKFGRPEHAMTLLLHSGRTLARAETADVMAAIQQQGFYLQMPPGEDELAR